MYMYICMYWYVCACIRYYYLCIQLIDNDYIPEEAITSVKGEAAGVSPLVETVQPSSPSIVTSDEVNYVHMYIFINKHIIMYVHTMELNSVCKIVVAYIHTCICMYLLPPLLLEIVLTFYTL